VIDPEILREVRRIQVRTNRLVSEVLAGGYTSVFRGSGIEFDEVREYAPGDDPRSVDWNVTARTGRPHIKKYVEERELTVLFLLDLSSSMRGGFGERSQRHVAALFCACLALSAIRNNDKVGWIGFTDGVERYVPAKKGAGHALRIVRDCLAYEASGTQTDVVPALEFAARVSRRKAIFFLVSDFLGVSGFDKELGIVARRHDVIAVRTLSPELRLANARGLTRLRDLETGRETLRDFSSAEVRLRYHENVAAWDLDLTARLRRARVDRIDLDTTKSIAEPILGFFRRRELRMGRG
jgi:uncharacterized protein (DUF58 family)